MGSSQSERLREGCRSSAQQPCCDEQQDGV
jgi:hypothetical protein